VRPVGVTGGGLVTGPTVGGMADAGDVSGADDDKLGSASGGGTGAKFAPASSPAGLCNRTRPTGLPTGLWSGGMIELATSETAAGIARFARACSHVVIQPERIDADSARITAASPRARGQASEELGMREPDGSSSPTLRLRQLGVVRTLENLSVSVIAVDRSWIIRNTPARAQPPSAGPGRMTMGTLAQPPPAPVRLRRDLSRTNRHRNPQSLPDPYRSLDRCGGPAPRFVKARPPPRRSEDRLVHPLNPGPVTDRENTPISGPARKRRR
jgi:hypothetical protein